MAIGALAYAIQSAPMGFYFRKSFGFGPFRINFSKSGIGTSFGVRGARISSGPRGTYINVGRNGFYYRQKIDGGNGDSTPAGNSDPTLHRDAGSRIDSADVERLVDSSSEQLINEINTCAQRIPRAAILALILGGILVTYFLSITQAEQTATEDYAASQRTAQSRSVTADTAYEASTNKKLKPAERKKAEQQYKSMKAEAETAQATAKTDQAKLDKLRGEISAGNVLVFVFSGIGAFAIFIVHGRDVTARQKPINYDLDELTRERFSSLEAGCQEFAQADRIWRIETRQDTSDWKRNAGAGTLITRRKCGIEKSQPRHVKPNVIPWSIDCNGVRLFFLPDHLYVFQNRRYGAIPYESLRIAVDATRFSEAESVPSRSCASTASR